MTRRYHLRHRSSRCFETIDVLVDEKVVGCIQQVDPTAGMTRVRHPRDLWLVWVGDPHKDVKGPERQMRSREDAIRHIVQAAQHGS